MFVTESYAVYIPKMSYKNRPSKLYLYLHYCYVIKMYKYFSKYYFVNYKIN